MQQIVDRILGLGDGRARRDPRADRARAARASSSSSSSGSAARASCARAIDGEVVDLGDEIVLDRTQGPRPRRRGRPHRRQGRRQGPRSPTRSSSRSSSARAGCSSTRRPSGEREPLWMSERFACIDCGISLPPIEPRMFSFNGPHGACPACDGIGARTRDRPGARRPRSAAHAARGRGRRVGPPRLARARHRDGARGRRRSASTPTCPWAKLPEEHAAGASCSAPATGARPGASARQEARRRGVRRDRPAPRAPARERRARAPRTTTTTTSTTDAIGDDELGRFVVTRVCDACKGRRLRPEALAVRLGEQEHRRGRHACRSRTLRDLPRTTLGAERRRAAARSRRASAPSPSRCSAR